LPEALLWSFFAQLASALRTVHASGLACRCIGPHHVLVTSGSRLRIGGIGIMDVLEHDQVSLKGESWGFFAFLDLD
jgi:PAB-dependent poly(A)-specific ribonuclease subunit 3